MKGLTSFVKGCGAARVEGGRAYIKKVPANKENK